VSIYEALVFVALAGAGSFVWHLYRKDSRSRAPGAPDSPAKAGNLMFGRATKN
jgi:hypothetical protein